MLIAPKDSKIDNVTIGPGFDLAKLAGDGKIATGDVKAVPVGKYAKAALEKLGAWHAAEPKFAMAESVRAALTLVARGEAALGIVYSTDAKVEPGVKIVGTFPADSHPPIIYPVAATSTAKPEAKAYLDYLRTSAAKAVLEKYGFNGPAQDRRPDLNACLISRQRMDRDPAVAADRHRGDPGRAAVRHRDGVAAGAQRSGARPCWTPGASAAGAAAGGDRLSAADPFGRRGPIGMLLADQLGIVFSFRWTGAALACGVMGFPLMVRPIRLSIEAIDRRLEEAAATLGAAHAGVPDRHPAAGAARHHRRRGAVLRQGARRVRRHDHLRLQHSRRDPDHLGRDLHLIQIPGGDAAAGAAGAGVDRDRARRAGRRRMAGAARPQRLHGN